MASDVYAPPARLLRAITLADYLDAAGIGSDDAATMQPCEWRLLAQAARANLPSLETRALVLRFLRQREVTRAMLAAQR